MKKFLGLLAAAVMVCGLSFTAAWADESAGLDTVDGNSISYTYTKTDTIDANKEYVIVLKTPGGKTYALTRSSSLSDLVDISSCVDRNGIALSVNAAPKAEWTFDVTKTERDGEAVTIAELGREFDGQYVLECTLGCDGLDFYVRDTESGAVYALMGEEGAANRMRFFAGFSGDIECYEKCGDFVLKASGNKVFRFELGSAATVTVPTLKCGQTLTLDLANSLQVADSQNDRFKVVIGDGAVVECASEETFGFNGEQSAKVVLNALCAGNTSVAIMSAREDAQDACLAEFQLAVEEPAATSVDITATLAGAKGKASIHAGEYLVINLKNGSAQSIPEVSNRVYTISVDNDDVAELQTSATITLEPCGVGQIVVKGLKAGNATITMTGVFENGVMAFTRSASIDLTVENGDLADADVFVDDATYTGEALTPAVTVEFAGTVLEQDVDYTLTYGSNVNAGTGIVTVEGIGNFEGRQEATFAINPADASAFAIDEMEARVYTGDPIEPEPVVTFNGSQLVAGTDYTLAYADNVEAGTATVIVAGMGNFEGRQEATFAINPADASAFAIGRIEAQAYTGDPIEPEPVVTFNGFTLVAGTDYTLTYADNVEVGVATIIVTGIGNFEGETTCTFQIQDVPGPTPEPVDPVTEIAGANRYETAALIAVSAYPDGAQSVIVVTGESFPDALGASVLAGMIDAPIILTESAELRSEAADCIEELGASEVVIVGGEAAVSTDVEEELEGLEGVEAVSRVEGSNRYKTADAVYAAASKRGECSATAILATGGKFADALSISGYACQTASPIFLVDEEEGLTYATQKALKSGAFDEVIIVGGEAAVSEDVEQWVDDLGLYVTRLAGEGRYETCTEIADYLSSEAGMQVDGAVIATGENFPDSLAGGVLTAKKNTVMLLANTGETQSFSIMKNTGDMTNITFLGGKEALPSNVRMAAKKAAGL